MMIGIAKVLCVGLMIFGLGTNDLNFIVFGGFGLLSAEIEGKD